MGKAGFEGSKLIELENFLCEALGDERKAEATYEAIIARFGPVRPFVNIVDAETRHSMAVERQMHRLGIPIPPNPWPGTVSQPETLKVACAAAIQAEIENIEMYDRMMPKIGDPAVRQTFQNLRAASHDNHLPAFRRCHRRASRRG
jgi:rubrerythrin